MPDVHAEPVTLRCADCHTEITLEQYRRKVPRCDECEVVSVLLTHATDRKRETIAGILLQLTDRSVLWCRATATLILQALDKC